MGPTIVTCVVEVWRLGLEPLCDTHLGLFVIPKTLTLTGVEFLEVEEKMEITGLEVRAIWCIMIKISQLNSYRSCIDHRAMCGH